MSKLSQIAAPLCLGFTAAISGCASNKLVEYDRPSTSNADTCERAEIIRYTTTREIRRANRDENADAPRIMASHTNGPVVDLGCKQDKVKLATLEAYADIRSVQIESAASLGIAALRSPAITPEQRMEVWRDLRGALTSEDPLIREATARALEKQGLSEEVFFTPCPPVSLSPDAKSFEFNLETC